MTAAYGQDAFAWPPRRQKEAWEDLMAVLDWNVVSNPDAVSHLSPDGCYDAFLSVFGSKVMARKISRARMLSLMAEDMNRAKG